jgi:hypothetical protein
MATITTDEWTLRDGIESGSSELYNLKDVPKQERNIISNHPDPAKELYQFLIRYVKAT